MKRMMVLTLLVACAEDESSTTPMGPTVAPVAAATRPLDAMPSADGAAIYFVTATGLFRATEADPVALAPLTDATSLVVADDVVFVGTADGVVTVPTTGGEASPLPGTEGFQVGMLDLTDRLIVAGADALGRPGVFAVELTGGAPVEVVTGLPEVPTGVLALAGGDYAVALPSGEVLRAQGRESERLYAGETLGAPAGMALAPTGELMISSLAAEGTAQVVLLDLATGEASIFDEVIGANRGAGGLHAAQEASVFAWAGVASEGRVYRISF